MATVNIIVAGVLALSGGLFIVLSLPLLKGKVPMNKLYGVRFSQSFQSDDAWYSINRYGARQMIGWSIPLLVLAGVAFVVPLDESEPLLIAFLLAPAVFAMAAAGFSYRYARGFKPDS